MDNLQINGFSILMELLILTLDSLEPFLEKFVKMENIKSVLVSLYVDPTNQALLS